jgi:ubiquinone/menaquinone biosynthesis C-methylase UbiE
MEDSKMKEIESKMEKFWDVYSSRYLDSVSLPTSTLMSNMVALGRVHKRHTILDAGCGPGFSTQILSLHIPNYNSTVYAFDFSNEMVKLCKSVYSENTDFNSNQDNHWELSEIDPNSKINVEKDTEEIRKSKIGKVVKFFQGSVSQLPFEDEQFDCYISNLVLNLCTEPGKAVKECFRVLKSGGVAVISIWGDRGRSVASYDLIKDIKEKHGFKQPGKSPYHLAEDIDKLKGFFSDAGFTDFRLQYTSYVFDCYSIKDYIDRFELINDEVWSKVKDDVEKEIQKQVVDQKVLPVNSCLIIVAFKP